jgi:hypothetical protein
LFGFTFPLFGQQLIDALGMGGGNSLLGGLWSSLPSVLYVWLNIEFQDARSFWAFPCTSRIPAFLTFDGFWIPFRM